MKCSNVFNSRATRIGNRSRAFQSQASPKIPRIELSVRLATYDEMDHIFAPIPLSQILLSHEEEIAQAPACYLWDYLRRSGASGFALALSGGADSCSVALIMYSLARKLIKEIHQDHHENVLADLRKIVRDPHFNPTEPKEIMNRILFTVFMSTTNSTKTSKERAARIANSIGSYHLDIDMAGILEAFLESIHPVFEKSPKFTSEGGTCFEDTALQNVQARARMALGYMMAQLIPSNITKGGFILTLSTMNLDEG
jgi:NAD+ synthase (glutamine-hydrolysing)